MSRSSPTCRDGPVTESSTYILIAPLAAWLVLDEVRLMEGASVENPSAFGARLRRVMEKALG